MFNKLEFVLEKYEELSMKVSDPEIINNQPLWQKHIKEMGEMEPIVNKYKEYKAAKESMATKNCVNWPRWKSLTWKTAFRSWKTN